MRYVSTRGAAVSLAAFSLSLRAEIVASVGAAFGSAPSTGSSEGASVAPFTFTRTRFDCSSTRATLRTLFLNVTPLKVSTGSSPPW